MLEGEKEKKQPKPFVPSSNTESDLGVYWMKKTKFSPPIGSVGLDESRLTSQKENRFRQLTIQKTSSWRLLQNTIKNGILLIKNGTILVTPLRRKIQTRLNT